MRQLRERGIYTLAGVELVAVKRTEEIFFLFTETSWNLHGPVSYRLSHGHIYERGELTGWDERDLVDTGRTSRPPRATDEAAYSLSTEIIRRLDDRGAAGAENLIHETTRSGREKRRGSATALFVPLRVVSWTAFSEAPPRRAEFGREARRGPTLFLRRPTSSRPCRARRGRRRAWRWRAATRPRSRGRGLRRAVGLRARAWRRCR